MGKEVYLTGAVLSVLVSLTLYLAQRREAGLFVGLWAPTLLLLGEVMVDEEQPAKRQGLLRRGK